MRLLRQKPPAQHGSNGRLQDPRGQAGTGSCIKHRRGVSRHYFFYNPFSSVRLLSWVHAKYKLPIMDAFESKYTKSARELEHYSAVDMLCLHSADRSAANASPDVSFLSGHSPGGLCTRREH